MCCYLFLNNNNNFFTCFNLKGIVMKYIHSVMKIKYNAKIITK